MNYPARAKGVTRHMRGDEAKEQCPEIELVKVPNIREKADLSKYRNAGKQVAAVLQTFTPLLTRASVDEAYMDITDLVQNRLVEMNQVMSDILFVRFEQIKIIMAFSGKICVTTKCIEKYIRRWLSKHW